MSSPLLRGEPLDLGGVRVSGPAALAPAALSTRILGVEFLFPSARVMVLHAGQIVEFDSPEELLTKEGVFSAMAKDAGIAAAENTAL